MTCASVTHRVSGSHKVRLRLHDSRRTSKQSAASAASSPTCCYTALPMEKVRSCDTTAPGTIHWLPVQQRIQFRLATLCVSLSPRHWTALPRRPTTPCCRCRVEAAAAFFGDSRTRRAEHPTQDDRRSCVQHLSCSGLEQSAADRCPIISITRIVSAAPEDQTFHRQLWRQQCLAKRDSQRRNDVQ
jgi:hypothetical protein